MSAKAATEGVRAAFGGDETAFTYAAETGVRWPRDCATALLTVVLATGHRRNWMKS